MGDAIVDAIKILWILTVLVYLAVKIGEIEHRIEELEKRK